MSSHTVIPFTCPACRHAGKVALRFAGRLVRCPHCGARVTVPPELADPPDTVLTDLAAADLPAVGWPDTPKATAWIGPPKPRAASGPA